MPPVVLVIGVVFTLVMVLLLLRELRDNRTRLRDREAERTRPDAKANHVTPDRRGEG